MAHILILVKIFCFNMMGSQQWHDYCVEFNWSALQASEHLAAVSKPKVNSIQLPVFTGRAREGGEHSADWEALLD